MSAPVLYPFADGDRLNQRNSYFYIPFAGRNFSAAWRKCRDGALKELGAPVPPSPGPASPLPKAPFRTVEALDALHAALRRDDWNRAAHELTDCFLQRFEVTKRLYTAYNGAFRAAAEAKYDDLALYVSFAQILERSYAIGKRLYYLNGLLKINDTLVAMRQSLTGPQRQSLAWILLREREHMSELATRHGVGL